MNYCDTLGQHSLNDYPFKGQVDWILGNATASSHDQATHEIWMRVNQGSLLADIRKDSVNKVVNTYSNLLKGNSEYPVYNHYWYATKPREDHINLVNTISNKSGVKVKEVVKILKHLQYADNDGSIVKGIHNPRTIDKSITKPPPDSDSWYNQIDLQKTMKYGAIGLGAFALIKIIGVLD